MRDGERGWEREGVVRDGERAGERVRWTERSGQRRKEIER